MAKLRSNQFYSETHGNSDVSKNSGLPKNGLSRLGEYYIKIMRVRFCDEEDNDMEKQSLVLMYLEAMIWK